MTAISRYILLVYLCLPFISSVILNIPLSSFLSSSLLPSLKFHYRIPKNVILGENPAFGQTILQLLQSASGIPKSAPQGINNPLSSPPFLFLCLFCLFLFSALQVLSSLVSNTQFLRADNFGACLRAFLMFMKPSLPSVLAINAMKGISSSISTFLSLSSRPLVSRTTFVYCPPFPPLPSPSLFYLPLSPQSLFLPLILALGLDQLFAEVLPLLGLSPSSSSSSSSSDPSTPPSSDLLKPSQVFAEKAKLRKKEETKKHAWSYFWMPVLQVFCDMCQREERIEVRSHAMSHLQKCILSSPLDIFTPQGWFICFEEV